MNSEEDDEVEERHERNMRRKSCDRHRSGTRHRTRVRDRVRPPGRQGHRERPGRRNWNGSGSSEGPAGEVVDSIRAMGGEAVANGEDVSDWEGSQRLVNAAIENVRRFGRPGQQRGHSQRPHARQHERRGVGCGDQGPPPRNVRPMSLGRLVLERAREGGEGERRPDHQHDLVLRYLREPRTV